MSTPHSHSGEAELPLSRRSKEIGQVQFLRVRSTSDGSSLMDHWTVDLHSDDLVANTVSDEADAKDAWKRAVYAVASTCNATSLELFAKELIAEVLQPDPRLHSAVVVVQSHLWRRLTIGGEPHPASFMKGSAERQIVTLTPSQEGFKLTSGFRDMTILQTTRAAGERSPSEAHVIRPSTPGNLPFAIADAEWTFGQKSPASKHDFAHIRETVREQVLATYARHLSGIAEDLLQDMSEKILSSNPDLDTITVHLCLKGNALLVQNRLNAEFTTSLFVPVEDKSEDLEFTLERSQIP